jgi:DNA (cytosine-5)-methyltransferase 1
MLQARNTTFTTFIPDPQEQRRQLELGMAVRSSTSMLGLLIDNFAGGGGASEGIEQAFGRSIDIAINHDGEALVMHTANHPGTAHYQEDVFDVHPGFITGRRQIDLGWFSPDCKHHSRAKGGKPRDQKIRGLAWSVLKWGALQKHQRPKCIFIENVVELLTWGPLDPNGRAIKEEAGRTFKAFIDALTTGLDPDHPDIGEIYAMLGADFPMDKLFAGLGYDVEYRELRACDYGVPTTRTRLFIIARCDGQPITWPRPTHGNPKGKGFAASGLKPWKTAADCIDFDLYAQSIFDRDRALVTNTLRRVAKGAWRHVLTNSEAFIVGAGGPAYAGKPVSAQDPLGTIATENHRQVAQPMLAPLLTEHANSSNQRTMRVDEPVRTLCAQVKGGHFSVVAPMIAPLRGTSEAHLGCHEPTAPTSVVSAQGTHHALVGANLVTIGYGERQGQDARAQSVAQPLGAAVTANKHALVETHMLAADDPQAIYQVDMGHGETCASGVGRWGSGARSVDRPVNTAVASGTSTAVAAVHMTHLTHHGERTGIDLRTPVPTVTGAHRGEQAIVAAWLEQANGGFYAGHGRPADHPVSAITSSGNQQQLVTAYCVKYEGEGITSKSNPGRVTMVQVPSTVLSEEHRRRAKQCADLLHEHLPEQFPQPAEMVLTYQRGQWWVLIDITLRMLTPRELARAQGFPDSYIIEPMVRKPVRARAKGGRRGKKGLPADQDWVEAPLSKTAQVRMIGNSVCPPLARALVEANMAEAIRMARAA